MSNCTIRIDLDNDAFVGNDCGPEVARILRRLADIIESASRDDLEGQPFTPRDINGNCVGTCDFEIDEPEGADMDEYAEERDKVRERLACLSRGQLDKLVSALNMGISALAALNITVLRNEIVGEMENYSMSADTIDEMLGN